VTATSAGHIGSSTGTNVSLNYAGGAGASTFSGSIQDSVNGGFGQTMSLNVNSGTLALTGTNSYSGATTIASGATLQLGNGGTTTGSVGPAAITNNGTLRFNSGAASNISLSNTISGTGNVVQSGGNTSLSGTNAYTGGTRLEGGTLAIGSDAAINNGVGGLTFAGGTLQLDNYSSNLSLNGNNVRVAGNAAVLTGPISGTGTTTFSGSGLKLTGVSTYTGNTTVSGNLELGGNGRLPAGTNLTITSNLGTLITGGFSQNFGSLTLGGAAGSAAIDLGAGASVLHFTNSSTLNWNTSILQINNWSGSTSGGGTDQIFIGSNGFSGLTHAQLNSIQFGVGSGALLLPSGELVPNIAGVPFPLPVRGDLNGDSIINSADLPVLLKALTNLTSYQTTHQLSDGDFLATADVDNSGNVTNSDIQSLLNLIASFGGGSVAAVPEPGTMALMGLGAMGLIAVRRKNRRRR